MAAPALRSRGTLTQCRERGRHTIPAGTRDPPRSNAGLWELGERGSERQQGGTAGRQQGETPGRVSEGGATRRSDTEARTAMAQTWGPAAWGCGVFCGRGINRRGRCVTRGVCGVHGCCGIVWGAVQCCPVGCAGDFPACSSGVT